MASLLRPPRRGQALQERAPWGGATGTTGTGTTGNTGGTGSGSAGTGTTSGTGTSSLGTSGTAQIAEVPAIVSQYAATTGGSTSAAAPRPAAVSRRPQDASNPGTGTTTGNTTIVTGNGGQRNNYAGRLTVTQYVDIFRLVPAARDVEKVTRDFYAIDLDRVANETALTVKDEFYQVLRDQDSVNTQTEQVRYATENVRIAQARYTAGAAAQFDVVTAQTTPDQRPAGPVLRAKHSAVGQRQPQQSLGAAAGHRYITANARPASAQPSLRHHAGNPHGACPPSRSAAGGRQHCHCP